MTRSWRYPALCFLFSGLFGLLLGYLWGPL
jgi:hypothetical protein